MDKSKPYNVANWLFKERVESVMSGRQKIRARQPDYLLKICLIGDGGVGKTCIARRLCHNTFSLDTQLTVWIDFYTYEFSIIVEDEENLIKLLIWDFGGQDQFKVLFRSYVAGVNGMFFVFDLLRIESLMKLEWWYNISSCLTSRCMSELGVEDVAEKLEDTGKLIDWNQVKLALTIILSLHLQRSPLGTKGTSTSQLPIGLLGSG